MRRAVTIAASRPPFCVLCLGGQRVELLGPAGVRVQVRCLHCTPALDAAPIPILSVPMRTDAPRRSTP